MKVIDLSIINKNVKISGIYFKEWKKFKTKITTV